MEKKKTYPENLLSDIRFNERFGTNLDYKDLDDDQMEGLEYFLSALTPCQKELMLLNYQDGMDFEELSEESGLHKDTVRWMMKRGLKKLNGQTWSLYVSEGYCRRCVHVQQLLVEEERRYCEHRNIKDQGHIYYGDICRLNLPVRCIRSLKREKLRTVRDIVIRILYADWNVRIRDLGAGSVDRIAEALQKEKLLPENYRELVWKEEMPLIDRELLTFQKLNASFCREEKTHRNLFSGVSGR